MLACTTLESLYTRFFGPTEQISLNLSKCPGWTELVLTCPSRLDFQLDSNSVAAMPFIF